MDKAYVGPSDNRKGFWRAKLPRFHTKPSNFCNIQIVIKSQPYTAFWSENWCPGYLEHALCCSEIHLAAAKSLEIIGHVTNCCKRPIVGLSLYDSIEASLLWPVTLLTLEFSRPAALRMVTEVARIQCDVK